MAGGRKGFRVWVYGPDGDFRAQFETATECMKAYGISRTSLVAAIRDGEPNRKTGLYFDYEVVSKEKRV